MNIAYISLAKIIQSVEDQDGTYRPALAFKSPKLAEATAYIHAYDPQRLPIEFRRNISAVADGIKLHPATIAIGVADNYEYLARVDFDGARALITYDSRLADAPENVIKFTTGHEIGHFENGDIQEILDTEVLKDTMGLLDRYSRGRPDLKDRTPEDIADNKYMRELSLKSRWEEHMADIAALDHFDTLEEGLAAMQETFNYMRGLLKDDKKQETGIANSKKIDPCVYNSHPSDKARLRFARYFLQRRAATVSRQP